MRVIFKDKRFFQVDKDGNISPPNKLNKKLGYSNSNLTKKELKRLAKMPDETLIMAFSLMKKS